MIQPEKSSYKKNIIEYKILFFVIAFALFSTLVILLFYNSLFIRNYYVNNHSLLEGISIFFSAMIFFVTFHSYEWSKNLRTIILGTVSINAALIDVFHTLTFKEVINPVFPHGNDMALKLYAAARILIGIGLLAAALVRYDRKSNLSRFIFLALLTFLNIIFLGSVLKMGTLYYWFNADYSNLYLYQAVIVALYIVSFIYFVFGYLKNRDKTEQLILGALLVFLLSDVIFIKYYNGYHAFALLGHFFRILGGYMVFQAMFSYSIQKPYNELSYAQMEMNNYTQNLEQLVEQGTNKIKDINEILLNDLMFAKDIKKVVLPPKHFNFPNAEIYAKYISASNISGQFYNLFRIDDDNIAMLIGSSASQGIPSTMQTIFLNQTIKSAVISKENDRTGMLILSLILKSSYGYYKEAGFENDVSLLIAIYNISHNTLTYSSIGDENYAAIFDNNKGLYRLTSGEQNPEEIMDTMVSLEEGQILIMYAGGSARYLENNKKGMPSAIIEKTINLNYGKHLIEIQENIIKNISKIETEKNQTDIAFIILEVKQ